MSEWNPELELDAALRRSPSRLGEDGPPRQRSDERDGLGAGTAIFAAASPIA